MTDIIGMMERVARALCMHSAQVDAAIRPNSKGERRYETVEAYADAHWKWWSKSAAVAVNAMRGHVSPEMEKASAHTYGADACDCFNAMLDAALSEQSAGGE